MIRVSKSGTLTMGLDDFRALDYGKLCAHLGLKPSQPHTRADGSRARRSRRRSKGGGS